MVRLLNVIFRLTNSQDENLKSESLVAVYIIEIIMNEVTSFIKFKIILDMREVKVKLEARSLEEYQEDLKTHRVICVIVYCLFFAI